MAISDRFRDCLESAVIMAKLFSFESHHDKEKFILVYILRLFRIDERPRELFGREKSTREKLDLLAELCQRKTVPSGDRLCSREGKHRFGKLPHPRWRRKPRRGKAGRTRMKVKLGRRGGGRRRRAEKAERGQSEKKSMTWVHGSGISQDECTGRCQKKKCQTQRRFEMCRKKRKKKKE